MFTGIIEGRGKLLGKRSAGGGRAFDFEAGFDLADPREGESIACNGVCLTAFAIRGRTFSADVSPETLSRTTLGQLSVGGAVNMERALRVTDRLGGHIVSGHVDCQATVKSIDKVGEYTLLAFSLPAEQSRYVIVKGSVTIDGISLTVNSCSPGAFAVSVIPHSLQVTTLGQVRVGSKVNLEVDIIGKYIESLLIARTASHDRPAHDTLSVGFLAENGFL
jgi:riboflavin synthase